MKSFRAMIGRCAEAGLASTAPWRKPFGLLVLALVCVGFVGCDRASTSPGHDGAATSHEGGSTDASDSDSLVVTNHGDEAASYVPTWAADAIFYQIFVERFFNGDPSNDPTHDSLEFADTVPESWTITPWTSDWYSRSDWEVELGPDFYEHGVFHRRYGGDLQGVIDKLDYLESLGINTIYFNPVFYARSLHKYDGNSFHHIDPHFGPDPVGDFALMAQETSDPESWHWTQADQLFLSLLQDAHARGIRVIIDGVFNHTGRDFFAFEDLRNNQAESPYTDWYMVQAYDDPATPENEFQYKGWWGVETLPEFADNEQGDDLHPGPKQYVFDITARWMDPNGDGDPSDGIDGWRLDVAGEVPLPFWKDWNAFVRQLNPDSYTVAEIWGDALSFLEGGGFSATMNYHGFSYPVKGFLIDGTLSASDAAALFDERRATYSRPMQYALQNLIDSHDTDRVASIIVNADREPYALEDRFDFDHENSPRNNKDYDIHKPDRQARQIQRLVALMQMTYVGAPMIYYGTESGMWGADDPGDRMPMVWREMNYEPQQTDPLGRPRTPDSVEFDEALFDFYQSLFELVRQVPTLRHGGFEFIKSDDAAQFLAYRRFDDKDTYLVGLNRGEEPYRWKIPREGEQSMIELFTASGDVGQFNLELLPGEAVVTLPGRDGVVLWLEPLE